MILKQLTNQYIPVELKLGAAPVIGVPWSNLVVSILKPGDPAWMPIAVASEELVEVGLGQYSLFMHGSDLSDLGPNKILIESLTSIFDDVKIDADILARSREEVQPANQCLLFGDLISADGSPAADQEIIVRIVDFPFSSSASLATTKPVVTRSNGNGHFEVNLLRRSTVMIQIDVSGVRKQFVVPDQPTLALVDAMNII